MILRYDIQGFRALAVFFVLVYHVWPAWLPGGFIGVDVFFVISGYLITALLRRELAATGSISFSNFYARRARRLLPASLLVLGVVLLAVFLLQPTLLWRSVAGDVIAAVLYGENWWLHFKALDYLAGGDLSSPVQHYWSLSIEEQFYFLWPVLMLAVYSTARHCWRGDPLALLRWTLLLIVLLSLGFSIWTALYGESGAGYFSTWTRAWQLGAGSLLALAEGGQQRAGKWMLHVGLVGMALSASALTAAVAYPGWWALGPTVSTVLCLAAGRHYSDSVFTRWMEARPVQLVGDVSYSLYLWHWPIVVFGRQLCPDGYGALSGSIVVSLSLAIAVLSKRWVEDLFRHNRVHAQRPWMVLNWVALGSLFVAGLAGLLTWSAQDKSDGGPANFPGAVAISLGYLEDGKGAFTPSLINVEGDVAAAYNQGCIQQVESAEVLRCTYGTDDAAVKIALVGDSHAVHWLPAFEELVRKYDLQVLGITKTSCAFSDVAVYHAGLKREYAACVAWSKAVVAELSRSNINYVVVSQSAQQIVPSHLGDPQAAVAPLAVGMLHLWRQLEAAGKTVIPIRSTPTQPTVVPRCAASHQWPFSACTGTQGEVLFDSAISYAARQAGKVPLDLTKYFCVSGQCPAVIGGVFVYRDSHHITATYMRTLAPMLLRHLSIKGIKPRAHVIDSVPLPDVGDVALLRPSLRKAKYDRGEGFADKCIRISGATVAECDYGPATALRHVVVVGDSMAANLLPALVAVGASKGWKVTAMVKDSCLFSQTAVYNRLAGGAFEDCRAWSLAVRQRLSEIHPDAVLVAQSPNYRVDVNTSLGASEEVLAVGVLAMWNALETLKIPVVVMDYLPVMKGDVPACLADESSRKAGCFGYTSGSLRKGVLTLAAEHSGRKLVSLTDQFCDRQYCPAVKDGIVVYRDSMQPTATFMRSLAAVLGLRLQDAVVSLAEH